MRIVRNVFTLDGRAWFIVAAVVLATVMSLTVQDLNCPFVFHNT